MGIKIKDKFSLIVSNIHKSFGGVHALKGVSIDLRPHEIHALVGENGAGKSTLIKVISGAHIPDNGQIIIEKELVDFNNPLDAQKKGIATIYQEPTLYPELSIAENIFMGHHPLRKPLPFIEWKSMKLEAARLLESLGQHLDTSTKVRGLTIAQMQMVEMAKALSLDAHILIMDEPTSSLTQHEVKDLFSIINKLKQKGVSIIFISHRLEEVFEIADRVTVLRDGNYIGTKDIKETSLNEIIRMMVGRSLDTLFPKDNIPTSREVLRVENLSRTGKFENISFNLRSGEILGLAGLVGAGRTDVAKAIFGLERLDAGDVYIEGERVKVDSSHQAMDLGLAYLPEDRQHGGLILGMNISQNITLTVLDRYANRGWIDTEKEGIIASELATKLQLRAAGLWQKAQQLSGGNQQKVVVAKWLATQPKILIMDEPTRGIDVGTKAAVHKLMSDLANQGMAILMISSELPEILGMSDRIVVMSEGQITGEFSIENASQEKIMGAATVGRNTK